MAKKTRDRTSDEIKERMKEVIPPLHQRTSPRPDVIPEAPPPGQENDPSAGLQPINGSKAPLQGTRDRAEAEVEEEKRRTPFDEE